MGWALGYALTIKGRELLCGIKAQDDHVGSFLLLFRMEATLATRRLMEAAEGSEDRGEVAEGAGPRGHGEGAWMGALEPDTSSSGAGDRREWGQWGENLQRLTSNGCSLVDESGYKARGTLSSSSEDSRCQCGTWGAWRRSDVPSELATDKRRLRAVNLKRCSSAQFCGFSRSS